MCTIIGKKFPNIGWVGVKNRDRSSPTDTNVIRNSRNDLEELTLVDDRTHWSEGMNSHGISIISSSLTPISKNDSEEHSSKNGAKIKTALLESTIKDTVRSLIKSKATGCIMIFDKDEMYLLEGDDKTERQIVRRITDDMVARTNHGIWIPSAGYQSSSNNKLLELRRISSEARLLIADFIVNVSKTPEEIMVLLAHQWDDNPQLTTLREPTAEIQTRTTEQLLLEPYKNIVLLRNTDGKLDFNQATANRNNSKVLVGILD